MYQYLIPFTADDLFHCMGIPIQCKNVHSVGRNFDFFYFLAAMDNAAMSTFLRGHVFSFLLTTDLGVELLGHIATLWLNI